MAYTKRQFIEAALEEIGLAEYVFDMQPEQLESALRRLDAMMATWNAKGIRIGYPLPLSPQDSTLDEDSNVPDMANEAIITNLAIKIAPSYGKSVSPDTKIAASQALDALNARVCGAPPIRQMPSTMPAGAGNKTWNYNNDPFLIGPGDQVLAGPDGPIETN